MQITPIAVSAVVDMDPTDFATTYNADLEDESIDLESSGYLKEIFQKSTTNEEGKVSQIQSLSSPPSPRTKALICYL